MRRLTFHEVKDRLSGAGVAKAVDAVADSDVGGVDVLGFL